MAKRYAILVSMVDDQDNEIAQSVTLETGDYEEAVAEFEDISDADFEDSQVEEDDDSEDDEETNTAASA